MEAKDFLEERRILFRIDSYDLEIQEALIGIGQILVKGAQLTDGDVLKKLFEMTPDRWKTEGVQFMQRNAGMNLLNYSQRQELQELRKRILKRYKRMADAQEDLFDLLD